MFTAALAQRGRGYTCNALQRSFDSLYTALIKAIQGKDRCRRYIVKMKAKGLNIALIRLLIVCYLTCNIFMFVYKFSRKIFCRMVTFSHLRVVKRKGSHIVLTQDILYFSQGKRKAKRIRDIQKCVIKCWDKKGALTRQC